ncbi:hypothetical protein ACFL20_01190 [Spirochaetota bacterium]
MIRHNFKTKACTFAILIMFFSSALYSQGKTDVRAKEKIQYIQNVLNKGEFSAQLWWYGWISIYSSLTIGQYTLSGVAGKYSWPGKDDRVNYIVGGSKSALGVAMLLIIPFTPAYAPGSLSELSQETDGELSIKLKEAERLMELSAHRAKRGRGWLKHVIVFVLNATGGIITWQCTKTSDSWKTGLINFASGFAVAEAMIWTQPTRAGDDWARYQKKYYGKDISVDEGIENNWHFTLYPGGFVFSTRL